MAVAAEERRPHDSLLATEPTERSLSSLDLFQANVPVHVKPAEPSVQPLASKQLLALWNAPLGESVDAAAQSVRRAGQEIPALGTAPIDAPVVAAGHAVQPGLVEESLSAAGLRAGQESPAPIQEPAPKSTQCSRGRWRSLWVLQGQCKQAKPL